MINEWIFVSMSITITIILLSFHIMLGFIYLRLDLA